MKKFTTDYVEQVVVKALGEQSDAQLEFRVWLREVRDEAASKARRDAEYDAQMERNYEGI